MPVSARTLLSLVFTLLPGWLYAADAPPSGPMTPGAYQAGRQNAPNPPSLWRQRPPSSAQQRYLLAEHSSQQALGASCQDLQQLAQRSGDDFVDALINLPTVSCSYGLFSLDSKLASTLYQAANLSAAQARFKTLAASYQARDARLALLTLYFRAGYYLSEQGGLPAMDAKLGSQLQTSIRTLLARPVLFAANPKDDSAAQEIALLITNMSAELGFLDQFLSIIQRYTVSARQPDAASQAREPTAAKGLVGVLTAFYYAHARGPSRLSTDPAYSRSLYLFSYNNLPALDGTESAYLLGDAARESLRFLQYPALKKQLASQAKSLLSVSSMTGTGSDVWLAAAEAIKYYAPAHCSDYGTCDYEQQLARTLLKNNYDCDTNLRIRSQDLTRGQATTACALMQQQSAYFHRMLQTHEQPVANDFNSTLEVVVFSNYGQYSKYASVIYGIRTDNGGMYLEGEPAERQNQARFIAHEANWLPAPYKVWNLEHEFVHYLDGRFNMYGDFAQSTQLPSTWWLEGLAEYLSKKNVNQPAIDAARSRQYRLSELFDSTYSMADYVNRAYPWGYMAVRFMFEKHRADIDAFLPDLRVGSYQAYRQILAEIGAQYDAEFQRWAQTANTSGEPPLPDEGLAACPLADSNRLDQNCAIRHLTAGTIDYATLYLPATARNLHIWTEGGTGDVDLYLAYARYPTSSDYWLASAHPGNQESLALANPGKAGWYHISLVAKQPYAEVTLNARYD